MSNIPSLASRKKTHSPKRSKQHFNSLTRSIAILGLIAVSNSLGLSPVLAAPTAPNVSINNQATGTFTDGDEPGAPQESVVSNVVTVTVAEVAGITITADNTPEPYPNALINFDFEIKNIGNDPTKFFLPTAPSSVAGGTAGTLQIVAYVDANSTKTPLTTPINITTANDTGAIGDGTLGGNTIAGSIPAGAAIIVRVPVTVTAAVNANVSVTLGNTTGSPNASNTPYIANTNDIYTVDNADAVAGEAAGVPINGDGTTGDGDVTKHRQEASAISTVLVQNPPLKISGTVFEDVNYGGGAGRDLVSSAGVARPNVQVEIYNASGVLKGQMLTDTNGQYVFDASNVTGGLTQGNTYQIRVVNSFVTSSRPGGCAQAAAINLPPDTCFQVPVQTFRTSGDTDSNNIADADQNRVGGEVPARKDAPANSGTQNLSALNSAAGQAVESLTTVALGSLPFTGVDFGFNFDTIVNTNNIGQGSLRQFITNSNALTNSGLDQVVNPNPATGTTAIDSAPGIETSIFMIPSTALTAGSANISLSSKLTVTDDDTAIDGRTQTANIGDTNTGTVGGSGQAVGISAQVLPNYPKPEVSLSMTSSVLDAIEIQGNGDSVRGLNFSTNIHSGIIVSGGSAAKPTLIQNNIIGLKPDGTAGSVWQGITANNGIAPTKYLNTLDNLISNNSFAGASISSPGLIQGNHFFRNGTGSCDDNLSVEQSNLNTITINKNLFEESAANGIEGYGIPGGVTITENTVRTAGRNGTLCDGSIENDGIRLFGSSSKITKNIINSNGGAGVVITGSGGTKNLISQNSFYLNGGLGIDIDAKNLPASLNPTGDGVSPNDGTKNTTPNNDMDYPIITSSALSSGILTIKGYVGNVATGSPTFAGATIEFFVGAADTNDKGKVFSTDPVTVSKLHAEGQTYIGGSTPGNLCITDANGLFNCSFPNASAIDAKNITATATDTAGNTSEFSVSNIDPRVLLVKRITAINGSTNTLNGDNLANYLQDDTNPYDDNTIETSLAPSTNFPAADTTFWPETTGKTSSDFLLGGMNGGNIKPKDVIEYTIYFLSNGDSTATNVLFCDRVPANVTFMPTAFDSSTTKAPGGVTESRGILTQLNGITASYTNVADGDAARYFPAGNDPKLVYPKVNCGGTNDNGAVVVDLGSLPNATAVGTPGSYGFVRFQGRVK